MFSCGLLKYTAQRCTMSTAVRACMTDGRTILIIATDDHCHDGRTYHTNNSYRRSLPNGNGRQHRFFGPGRAAWPWPAGAALIN